MTTAAIKKIRLLIADDHHILLEGMVSVLQNEPNFEITDTAENGRQVIELIKKNDYDICLLDISMPEIDGMEAAKWIIENKPGTKIIILTTHDEEEIIAEMVQMGVSGYLVKTSTRHELVEGINKIINGKLYFSEQVQAAITQGYTKTMNRQKALNESILLTQREKEIVRLLAKEYTNDKIAEQLHISHRTVETHRRNIMQKTKAHNLAGLVKYAYSLGLIR